MDPVLYAAQPEENGAMLEQVNYSFNQVDHSFNLVDHSFSNDLNDSSKRYCNKSILSKCLLSLS